MRRAYVIEYQGQPMKLRELSTMLGIPYPTLTGRWQRGDRGERLLRPIDAKRSRKGRW